MRFLPFLLIFGLALVLMVGEADAELDAKDKEWDSDLSGISQVDISADGEYIAAGSTHDEVFLINKDDEDPIWEYDTGSDVNSVAISDNGNYIAAGSEADVLLFGKSKGTPLWTYNSGDNGDVSSVDISKDGRYVVAGAGIGVYLFNKDSSTPLWNYTIEGEVLSVVISNNGEYIAVSSNNGNLYLFNKEGPTPLWIYDDGSDAGGYSHDSFHISISADGENVVAGKGHPAIEPICNFYVFNKNSNISLWTYTADSNANDKISGCPVAISADGDYIAAGSGKKFYLFNKNIDKPIWNYDTGGSYALSVAISQNGDYIVAGSGGSNNDGSGGDSNDDVLGKLYLFEKNDNQPLWYHDGNCCGSLGFWGSEEYHSVAISANGDYIVASEGDVEFFTKKDSFLGFLSEFFDAYGYYSIITLAILAGLFQFRKDTGTDDTINKLLRIPLYGIAFLVFLISLFVLWVTSFAEVPIFEKIFLVAYYLGFATLFAVTGIFLGHETYDPSPSSYSHKSSIPSSKPIFGNKPKTPIFTPQNEMTAIECPGCSAQMDVPKLGTIQDVTCNECGLSGEIEI